MKVLFVASTPTDAEKLLIEYEVTQLQQLFSSSQNVHFIALPQLSIEELPLAVSKHRPDILHISSHGERDNLFLANSARSSVEITGPMLRAFLNFNEPPRLVYLNSCNSGDLAKDLIHLIPMAIGTTAPLTNRAALSSALLFYERLIGGTNVEIAYEAGKASIEALQKQTASSQLEYREGVNPAEEFFNQIPRIVARFYDDDISKDDDDEYSVELGIWGCTQNTSQIVIFTDDSSFIDPDSEGGSDLASDLCWVERDSPIRNAIWIDEEIFLYGDIRLYGCGISGDSTMFSVSSTLCKALENQYKELNNGTVPDKVLKAISELRGNDGSGLRDRPLDSKKSKKPSKKRKKSG